MQFNSVDFWADTSIDWIGRDKIVRQYPFKDFPTLQDVGGVSEPGSFAAYVFGDDAFTLRDDLMRALKKPGPGDLVHPWFGLMRVEIIGKVSVKHSTLEGGVVRFDINYLLADNTTYPQAVENTQGTSQDAIDAARSALVQDFASNFDVTSLPAWAQKSALASLNDALGTINGTVNKLLTKPPGFVQFETDFRLLNSSLRTLVQTPDSLGLAVLNVLQGLSSLGDDFTDALFRQQSVFGWTSGYTPSPFSTPARIQEQQNNTAIETLVQVGALLVAAETIATADFTTEWTYVDAMQWRDILNIQYQLALDAVGVDAYLPLLDAMAACSNDLVIRSNHLGRVSTIKTKNVFVPAMLVSYQQYGVIDWEDEIVQNNNIDNPLFIPPNTTLEMISHDR